MARCWPARAAGRRVGTQGEGHADRSRYSSVVSDGMTKRGRRLGQKVNARDERGWMIPRPGTVRRRVYDMMVNGNGAAKIHKALGISYASCIMHQQNITKSDRLNAQRYNVAHPDEPVQVPGEIRQIRIEQGERKMAADIDGAKLYLETGGLGEVMGFASVAMDSGEPKVQMDTDMAIALCLLADEALKRRSRH